MNDLPSSCAKPTLAQINAGQPVKLNLVNMGLFQSREENTRIANLAVVSMTAHLTGGGCGLWSNMDLYMDYSGDSKLSKDGEVYQFHHYNDNTDYPIRWGARYDGCDAGITQITPSAADQSLLRALLARAGIAPTPDNILLYSRPSAWADVALTKHVNTSTGADIVIDSMRLELTYDFQLKPAGLVGLDIRSSADQELSPYYVVDQTDLKGRRDGRDQFLRTYPLNATVALTAPTTYGLYTFVRWADRFGNDYPRLDPTNPVLHVAMGSDQAVLAKYAWVRTYYMPIVSQR